MTKTSRFLTLLMVVSFIFILTGVSQMHAQEKVKCAVMGKEINKEDAAGSMEYEGKTYYFCCTGCETKFKEDPEKYISGQGQGGESHGEHSDEATDPVCGMKIKKDEAEYSHEYNGKTYYFCMEGCREKFVENPEEYIKTGDEMATCPVSGEEIKKSDAAGSMEYKGKTYYFCCAGCKEKFEKNPEEYIKIKEGSTGGGLSLKTAEGACCAAAIKKK